MAYMESTNCPGEPHEKMARREGHSCSLLTPYHIEVKAKPSSKHKCLSHRGVGVFVLHASVEAPTC